MLGAVAGPFDRPAEPLRRLKQQRIFAVDETFGAEAAADIGRDDAQLLRPALQHLPGDHVAHAVHALRAAGQHETVLVRLPFADRRARLHVVADEPVVDELDADGRVPPSRRRRRSSSCRRARRGRRGCCRARARPAACPCRARWPCRPRRPRIRSRPRSARRRPAPARGVSATTKATASPTWLTRSRHRIGMSRVGARVPSGCFSMALERKSPRCVRSAAVSTRCTPGACSRFLGRGDGEAALGDRRAQHEAMQQPVRRDIVGVAARAR